MRTPVANAATAQADLRQELSRKRTDLEASATFLTFDPGLYAIEFAAPTGSMSDVGLPLPCARLEPVANPNGPGRLFVAMTPEGGWLSRRTTTAHVLVVGGQAGAVLTLYRPTDGTPMPEVRFRGVTAGGAPAVTAGSPGVEAPEETPSGSARLLVHIEGVGDRTDVRGEWLGDVSGQRALEGFALSLPEGVAASDLEYQGIMGEDWRTPWFAAGSFCGSRGLQLPLLGFRMRLTGEAAAQYQLRLHGRFAGQDAVGPLGPDEDCEADGKAMTAMRVELIARPAPEAAAPEAPASAPKRRRWGAKAGKDEK